MRIAIHAIYYHPEVGGMESHIKDIAEEFVGRGHEVDIICGSSIPGLPEYEEIAGVKVTRTRWFGRNQTGWLRYVLSSQRSFLDVARYADIVHGQGFPCALPVRTARRKYSIPGLVTVHSSHFLKLAPNLLLRPGLKWLFATLDHILTPSEELADAVRLVAPDRPLERYVNSVNTRVFRAVEPAIRDPGKTVIVCPRRLVEKNGVRFAIMALPRILKTTPAKLYMVGPGPLREEMEGLAKSLDVADSVVFLGSQPHDRMPAILSSADVTLIPSLMEATSIAALESMACERTIAASDVGGLPEIIDDKVGVLFRPGDPEEIASKVLDLLNRDRATMGRTARQRVVDNWSAARLADHHLALYRRLISQSRGATAGSDG